VQDATTPHEERLLVDPHTFSCVTRPSTFLLTLLGGTTDSPCSTFTYSTVPIVGKGSRHPTAPVQAPNRWHHLVELPTRRCREIFGDLESIP